MSSLNYLIKWSIWPKIRIYEIEELITYAKSILPEIATEKKKLEEEKFLTETLLQQCDTWIAVCMDSLSCLDKKLESELTRNDGGILETKKVRFKIEPLINVR